jgi:hypothetical protein
MSYLHVIWRKDNYKFEKSYRYKNDVQTEVVNEIDKMEGNKKSLCSDRMANRKGIIQRNINPFLKSDYLKDLENQDTFLRPKDSNIPNNNLKKEK